MKKGSTKEITMEGVAKLVVNSQKVTIERLEKSITHSHENLARMVANGFSEQEKTLIAKIESEIQGIEQRLGAQILGTNNRIDALTDTKVSWDAHTPLAGRVTRLENSARLPK